MEPLEPSVSKNKLQERLFIGAIVVFTVIITPSLFNSLYPVVKSLFGDAFGGLILFLGPSVIVAYIFARVYGGDNKKRYFILMFGLVMVLTLIVGLLGTTGLS